MTFSMRQSHELQRSCIEELFILLGFSHFFTLFQKKHAFSKKDTFQKNTLFDVFGVFKKDTFSKNTLSERGPSRTVLDIANLVDTYAVANRERPDLSVDFSKSVKI